MPAIIGNTGTELLFGSSVIKASSQTGNFAGNLLSFGAKDWNILQPIALLTADDFFKNNSGRWYEQFVSPILMGLGYIKSIIDIRETGCDPDKGGWSEDTCSKRF